MPKQTQIVKRHTRPTAEAHYEDTPDYLGAGAAALRAAKVSEVASEMINMVSTVLDEAN